MSTNHPTRTPQVAQKSEGKGGVTRLILTRHGHVQGILPERFRGQADLPLTPEGREEAVKLGYRISQSYEFDAIYCSPLSRCVDTAAAVARNRNNATPTPIAGLTDIHYGAWQGCTHEEIAVSEPAKFMAWREKPESVEFPSGESLHKLQTRVVESVKELFGCHPDGTFVVVGHDSVNRVLLLHVLGLPLSRYWRISQSPCCINVIDRASDGYYVHCINDTGHLMCGETERI